LCKFVFFLFRQFLLSLMTFRREKNKKGTDTVFNPGIYQDWGNGCNVYSKYINDSGVCVLYLSTRGLQVKGWNATIIPQAICSLLLQVLLRCILLGLSTSHRENRDSSGYCIAFAYLGKTFLVHSNKTTYYLWAVYILFFFFCFLLRFCWSFPKAQNEYTGTCRYWKRGRGSSSHFDFEACFSLVEFFSKEDHWLVGSCASDVATQNIGEKSNRSNSPSCLSHLLTHTNSPARARVYMLTGNVS